MIIFPFSSYVIRLFASNNIKLLKLYFDSFLLLKMSLFEPLYLKFFVLLVLLKKISFQL